VPGLQPFTITFFPFTFRPSRSPITHLHPLCSPSDCANVWLGFASRPRGPQQAAGFPSVTSGSRPQPRVARPAAGGRRQGGRCDGALPRARRATEQATTQALGAKRDCVRDQAQGQPVAAAVLGAPWCRKKTWWPTLAAVDQHSLKTRIASFEPYNSNTVLREFV
jgi:hypothetical protein